MHRLLHELRLFFIALQFFTRVPIPAWVGFEPAWLQQCARHFPAVGALVGLFSAAVFGGAMLLFPPLIAALLAIAASVWLTGGFHEDGWADTCDGLGGAVSREKALLIMKDSRLGSYGALGLILLLGLKAATLAALAERAPLLAVLLLAWGHMASRLAPLLLMRSLPYAGDAEHAKAKPLATQIGTGPLAAALLTASALTLPLLAGPWPTGEVLLMLAAQLGAVALTLLWMQRWLRRRLGGYTGDNLGASQQLSELMLLLTALAVLPHLGLGTT